MRLRFHHRFVVRATMGAVWDFHSRPSGLAELNPPLVRVSICSAPKRLSEGATMRFVLWLGIVPVPWVARYSDVSPRGFTDSQLRGPFRYWRHRHAFVPLDGARTEVVDEVEAQLATHPLHAATGLLIWLGLPVLFAYRTWKTRRLLAKHKDPRASHNSIVYKQIPSIRSRGSCHGDGCKRGIAL